MQFTVALYPTAKHPLQGLHAGSFFPLTVSGKLISNIEFMLDVK